MWKRVPFLCERCENNKPTLCDNCRIKVDARNKLVMDNMGLIGHTINRYFGRNCVAAHEYPQDDARSDGLIGLMRAAEMFQPGKGYKFSTYAPYWIFHHLQDGWARHRNIIRIPRRDRANQDDQNVRVYGLFDSHWEHDRDYLAAMIPENRADPLLEQEADDIRREVNIVLDRLEKRQAFVLRLRMQGNTLESVGNRIGVSKEMVRLIELRAKRAFYIHVKKDRSLCSLLPFVLSHSRPPSLPPGRKYRRKSTAETTS